MDEYERGQVSEAFKDVSFNAGETIIKESEDGKDVFFLLEGEAFAQKDVEGAA